MDIPRSTREELGTLSKEIFGSTSRWQKILDKGTLELVTETVTEEVPGENGAEPTKKETQVPVLMNGTKQFTVKRYTLDTLKGYLLELKAKREAFLAMIKKQEEEKKAQEEKAKFEKKIQETFGGSAL